MLKSFYPMLRPVYPLLIQQFVDDYKLMEGIAVDIGTGPGFLGLELAKITFMNICFVDMNEEALDQAKKNFNLLDVDNKAEFIRADVSALPFSNDYADFVMSRGSIWFWEEPEKGLREIYRILKPGGAAIIGGGLGRYIPQTMRKRLIEENRKEWEKRGKRGPVFEKFSEIINSALAEKAGLSSFKIITEDEEGIFGKWVEIRKE